MVEPTEESVMGVLGWIFAVILVALLLPLAAIIYFDNLVITKKAEELLKKVEKIERQIERKNRDKSPDSFDDNPVFDRVRKPLPLRMPRPDKLE